MNKIIIFTDDYIRIVGKFFWDHGGALIACFSAWATWRAAKEAARSADIASQSMQKSTQLADATLRETQSFNRRSSFENRYSLLLEQHNFYHQQVCDYIDRKTSVETPNEMTELLKNATKTGYLDKTLQVLTGHQIVSRYMRILYHLLKFVDEEFYIENDVRHMKNYTSPLRSTIRNDVMYLIAVNALNVITIGSKESGYPAYQKMLHKFDFFDHAVFLFPSEPNKLTMVYDNVSMIQHSLALTSASYLEKLRSDIIKGVYKTPPFQIDSPAIICAAVYKNYLKDSVRLAIDTYDVFLMGDLKDKLEEILSDREKISMRINSIFGWEYRVNRNSDWKSCTKTIKRKFGYNVFKGMGYIYKDFTFRDSHKKDPYNYLVKGDQVVELMEFLIKFNELNKHVRRVGGIDSLVDDYIRDFKFQIKDSILKIRQHDLSGNEVSNRDLF